MWRLSWFWQTLRHDQPALWGAARKLADGDGLRWTLRFWWLLNAWSYQERAQLVAWHRELEH